VPFGSRERTDPSNCSLLLLNPAARDVIQMKQLLRKIYHDLANGGLSQKEALERIKVIKLREQGRTTGVLLATPTWQASPDVASLRPRRSEFTEHHIVLCELSAVNAAKLESLLPHARYLLLRLGQQSTVEQRYSDYALACFDRIQTILQGKPRGDVLVQIVVADQQEHGLLAGLAGLLKTAALETPQFVGQLILAPSEITAEELSNHLQDEKNGGADPVIRYQKGARSHVPGRLPHTRDQERV